jgi:hypothetical protein
LSSDLEELAKTPQCPPTDVPVLGGFSICGSQSSCTLGDPLIATGASSMPHPTNKEANSISSVQDNMGTKQQLKGLSMSQQSSEMTQSPAVSAALSQCLSQCIHKTLQPLNPAAQEQTSAQLHGNNRRSSITSTTPQNVIPTKQHTVVGNDRSPTALHATTAPESPICPAGVIDHNSTIAASPVAQLPSTSTQSPASIEAEPLTLSFSERSAFNDNSSSANYPDAVSSPVKITGILIQACMQAVYLSNLCTLYRVQCISIQALFQYVAVHDHSLGQPVQLLVLYE